MTKQLQAGNWQSWSFAWFRQPKHADRYAIVYTSNDHSDKVTVAIAKFVDGKLGNMPGVLRQSHSHPCVESVHGYAIQVVGEKGGRTLAAKAWDNLGAFADFAKAYFDCAIWSSNDEDDCPLDSNYTLDDFDDHSIDVMLADAWGFWNQQRDHLSADPEQGGHDYWLTRNGHGCGFWDGDWSEPAATTLTEASQRAGERYLYVENDLIFQD